jgi:hypothetical protein
VTAKLPVHPTPIPYGFIQVDPPLIEYSKNKKSYKYSALPIISKDTFVVDALKHVVLIVGDVYDVFKLFA